MNLREFNSLIDLFFYQAKKQKPENIFLEWLNTVNRKKFTWSETTSNIYKLSSLLKNNSNKLLNFFKFIIVWWAKRDSNSHSIATIGF